MRITNWQHIEAPLLPPDDSLAVAAEAEYIADSIGSALTSLADARIAAENERIGKAKEHIQTAIDCLSELVED